NVPAGTDTVSSHGELSGATRYRRQRMQRFPGSSFGLLILGLGACLPLAPQARADEAAKQPARPHVLLVALDDLNHWVHYLGPNDQAQTPNLDRLARRGVRFTRAYCAAPVCNPSRAALMSGLLPSTSAVYDNSTDWRPLIAEDLPLTTHFRKAGYWVG